jgi:hypothetical protein
MWLFTGHLWGTHLFSADFPDDDEFPNEEAAIKLPTGYSPVPIAWVSALGAGARSEAPHRTCIQECFDLAR